MRSKVTVLLALVIILVSLARIDGKKPGKRPKPGCGKNCVQQKFKIKKTALLNFDSEIASLSSSNLDDFKMSQEQCGTFTYIKCVESGFMVWRTCKKKCKGDKQCSLSCVKKKVENNPICKNCIARTLKALCCHFIGGECCANTESDVTGSFCCGITNEETTLIQESSTKISIDWKKPMEIVTKCVEKGTIVSFVWDGNYHNVNIMTEGDWTNCSNFSNKGFDEGPFNYTATEIGNFFFACGVENHCSTYHMKANITVANNCENVPPEELFGTQEGIITRMNVSSISQSTPGLIEAYNAALKSVKAWSDSRNYTNIANYHGEPFMCNATLTGPGHEMPCCIPHWGGPDLLFTPWHRLIIFQMEQSLRAASKNILGIPYWDWTTPPSDGNDFPYLARQGEWLKGPIKEKDGSTSQFTSRNHRPFDYTYLATTTETAFCAKTFSEFNHLIQNPHNYVHSYVGGDMCCTLRSSYDPIFYLHHSYVDLQYAYYQELQILGNYPISFGKHATFHMYPFAQSDNPYPTSYKNSTGPQGLDYENVFKYKYEKLIFKGMTPKEFHDNEICKHKNMHAGLFLKKTHITSSIDFDILHNNKTTYAGSLYTFGSNNQNPDFYAPVNPNVILYDVTELVANPDNNVNFAVSKYTDVFGNNLPINETFRPIIVYQEPNSESYIFRLHVEHIHDYAPVMYGRIGHHVEFLKNGEVVSGHPDVTTWVGGADNETSTPVYGKTPIEYQEHKFMVNNEYGQTNITIGYDLDFFEDDTEILRNFPGSGIETIPWNLNWLKKNPTVYTTNCLGTSMMITSSDETLSMVTKVDKGDYDKCTNLWTKGTDGIYGLLVDTSVPGTYYYAEGKKTGTSTQNYCNLGWKIAIHISDCNEK